MSGPRFLILTDKITGAQNPHVILQYHPGAKPSMNFKSPHNLFKPARNIKITRLGYTSKPPFPSALTINPGNEYTFGNRNHQYRDTAAVNIHQREHVITALYKKKIHLINFTASLTSSKARTLLMLKN